LARALKWENVKAEDLMISRLTKFETQGSVIAWIKTVKEEWSCFNAFMDFITVSGLRCVEAIASYNLISDLSGQGKLNEYYNTEKEILEHFRFKQLFIRNNKKAFASIVPRALIERVSVSDKITLAQITNRIKRKGWKPRFNDIREYFATQMTKHLSQSEIDFLQGRISGSVFMRNYFNPALITDLKERVFKAIDEMKLLS
jgi:intergrase/recombinase